MNAPFTRQQAATEYRLATVDDAAELAGLFAIMFAESDWSRFGLSYDIARMRKWLAAVIDAEILTQLVALDEGEIVGAAAFIIVQNYTDKPIAQMDKFFVRPDHRRSETGRALLQLAEVAARERGARLFQVFVNAGVHGAANLFRKYGFRETPYSTLLGKEI